MKGVSANRREAAHCGGWPVSIALATVSLALVLSGCQTVYSARVWNSGAREEIAKAPLVYPELQELPELRRKENWGLAFSGGGTVAGTAAVAQLRVLAEAGLLDRFRYVSTISGGTWGVLPYIFLNPQLAPPSLGIRTQAEFDRRYLGSSVPPERLTLAALEDARSSLAIEAVTGANAHLSLFRGDENFANLMARWFLRPVGLDDQRRSYAWSRDYFRQHIAPQNGTRFSEDDFHFAAPGRPFLIAGAALERSHRISTWDKLSRVLVPNLTPNTLISAFWPADLTPLYAGVGVFDGGHLAPGLNRNTIFPEPEIGSGFVEPLGFDTHYLGRMESEDGPRARVARIFDVVNFRRQPAFSLADVCAASGSAPAAALGSLVDSFGLRPEFQSWPVSADFPSIHSREHAYVDGGSCDNTGLGALLARGVDKAIVFLNGVGPYRPRGNQPAGENLPTMFTALFGHDGLDGFRNKRKLEQSDTNCFFKDPERRLLTSLDEEFAQCARRGDALVAVRRLRTNPTLAARARYGIAAGREVTICFVYAAPFELKTAAAAATGTLEADALKNDRWLDGLPRSVRALFRDPPRRKAAGLDQFPAFPVFFANQSKIQRLRPEQANALSHFTAFRLTHALPTIRERMGL